MSNSDLKNPSRREFLAKAALAVPVAAVTQVLLTQTAFAADDMVSEKDPAAQVPHHRFPPLFWCPVGLRPIPPGTTPSN